MRRLDFGRFLVTDTSLIEDLPKLALAKNAAGAAARHLLENLSST